MEGRGGRLGDDRWGELELAREALRSVGAGAWTWDVRSGEVLWSDDVADVLGIAPERFAGTYEAYLELLPPEARELLSSAVRDCLEGRSDHYVIEHPIGPEGEGRRWLECRGRVWRSSSGEPLRLAGTVMDVSARRRLAVERDRLHEELERARHLESLGHLAGGVAHDFNNLLTIILGYAELGLRQSTTGRLGAPAFEEIADAATKAAALTGKLLAFARRQRVEPAHEDVGQLVVELEGLLARTAGERLRVEVRVPETPAVAFIDRGQLEQVVINLVANARDAMPHAGRILVEVSVSPALVRGGDDTIVLQVVDEGCGMDAETQRRAFEPFFTTKPRDVGTGLGLASAFGVVRQAGGTIELRSEPGRGTEVRVVLPRSTAAASVREPISKLAARGSGSVLLVEDNDAVRTMATRALEDHGYTVIAARNGDDALERVLDRRPDAAVIDVVLPGISGIEVADALDRSGGAVPVVFVSGLADFASGHDARQTERRFLRKPYAPAELVLAVEQLVAHAAR